MKQKMPEADAERPLMAKALADAVDTTKRRVQLWTDAGALHAGENGRPSTPTIGLWHLPIATPVKGHF